MAFKFLMDYNWRILRGVDKMKVTTSRFGEIEIEEEDIVAFPKGLPGFDSYTKYVIVSPEQDEPFAYLQSLQDKDLVFIITDPFLFYPEYDFELSESAVAELGIESPGNVLVRSIISIPNELDQATINLVAPIIINGETRLGKQVVLGKTPYQTRHPLFAAVESK